MGKFKDMNHVKLILSTYLTTKSLRKTAKRLAMSKNTVKKYINLGRTHTLNLSDLLLLPDAEFIKVFYSSQEEKITEKERYFLSHVDDWLKALQEVGVNRKVLWDEYKRSNPNGYGYSQFCEKLYKEAEGKDLTLHLVHEPGEVMQVDFAGKKLKWMDLSGTEHKCEVLVAVLPFSQKTFVVALPSQKVLDFVDGLNKALVFFGKLPQKILSDNLKSFVTKADRYEPKFNDLCLQLSAFYQIDLQAARVRKPKDKASVENMVRTVYSRIYAPLRHKTHYSLEELNSSINEQLIIHNNTPFQKKEGSRQSLFKRYEFSVMRDLPSDLFEVKKTRKGKIQKNYHFYLSEDKHYYSVPYRYASRDAVAYYTLKTVEMFIDNERVAIHKRLSPNTKNPYQTKEEHMPKNHQQWREAEGFNAPYFRKMATKIGPATYWAMEQVLTSRMHQAQTYRSCMGILGLGRQFSKTRLENAARRCQKAGKANYSMLKNILNANLDKQEEQPNLFNIPDHDNIRGPEAYE